MAKHARKLRRSRKGGDENENKYVFPKQPTHANDPVVVERLLQARKSLRNPFPKEPLSIKTPQQFQQVKLTPTPKSGRRTRRHKRR